MVEERTVPVGSGAEAFVELLNANDVDYIFLNPGTDTFPVQEAISRLVSEKRRFPELVLCPDESVAMSAAHGYFQVTGRAQVVLVHVDAGTLQVGGALHNAQRGRIHHMDSRDGLHVIRAHVPMAEMFGYATDLRSVTQGRGNYSMHYSHYSEVPKVIGEQVVARMTGAVGF